MLVRITASKCESLFVSWYLQNKEAEQEQQKESSSCVWNRSDQKSLILFALPQPTVPFSVRCV